MDDLGSDNSEEFQDLEYVQALEEFFESEMADDDSSSEDSLEYESSSEDSSELQEPTESSYSEGTFSSNAPNGDDDDDSDVGDDDGNYSNDSEDERDDIDNVNETHDHDNNNDDDDDDDDSGDDDDDDGDEDDDEPGSVSSATDNYKDFGEADESEAPDESMAEDEYDGEIITNRDDDEEEEDDADSISSFLDDDSSDFSEADESKDRAPRESMTRDEYDVESNTFRRQWPLRAPKRRTFMMNNGPQVREEARAALRERERTVIARESAIKRREKISIKWLVAGGLLCLIGGILLLVIYIEKDKPVNPTPPTFAPTVQTAAPVAPTQSPSISVSSSPSNMSSTSPTQAATETPSIAPTSAPSLTISSQPSAVFTPQPSVATTPPTLAPTICNSHSVPADGATAREIEGFAFDLNAMKRITINEFSLHLDSQSNLQIEIWTKSGSWSRFDFYPITGDHWDRAGWTQVASTSGVVGNGAGQLTSIGPFASSVTVEAGSVQGFYIWISSKGALLHELVDNGVQSSNADLSIERGAGFFLKSNPNPALGSLSLWGNSFEFEGTIDYCLSTAAPTPAPSPALSKNPNACNALSIPTNGAIARQIEGFTFDLNAVNSISIKELSLHLANESNLRIEVWTKQGTWSLIDSYPITGDHWDRTGWTQVISVVGVDGNGSGKLTSIGSFPTPVTVTAGSVQGFYIWVSSKTALLHEITDDGIQSSNKDLSIERGAGFFLKSDSNPASGSLSLWGNSLEFEGRVEYCPSNT